MQRRRFSIIGPLLLVIIGALFLLNNFGVLPWSLWDLWRFWPLILVFIGLELVLGRGRWGIAVTIVAVIAVLIVVGALLISGYLVEEHPSTASERITKELEGATEVSMEIGFGAGRLHLRELSDSGNLMEAEFKYDERSPRASVSYRVNSKGRGQLHVRTERRKWSFGFWGNRDGDEWDIRLSPRVPLNIRAEAGVGRSTFDLSGLRVSGFDLDAGVGEITVIFPTVAGATEAKIGAGVGDVTLRIPEGVGARIQVDVGLGSVQIADRFTRSGDYYVSEGYTSAENRLELDVNGGIGRINIE